MPRVFKRRFIKYAYLFAPLAKAGIFFLLLVLAAKLVLPVYNFTKQNNLSPNLIANLIFNREPQLNQYKGRTNVIILGIAGGEHDGADLTDSMIFISIDYKKKDAVEVSLPRDIWSTALKDKINTAYHYGEEKKKVGGLILAKSIVEEVVGQPVHYAWLIDFSGFKKLIDLAGGVDVNVEKSFTDKGYPITGRENDSCGGDPTFACRYETLHFDAGLTHMDGEGALKFVRSRHAEGDEGTDFARSRRQQAVISALKSKVFNIRFILNNLKNAKKLAGAFDDATDTDMNLGEQILFFKSFLSIPNQDIRKITLDNGDDVKGIKGFLVSPPAWQYDGAWVLNPRIGEGDFSEIHQFIACNMENPSCPMKP